MRSDRAWMVLIGAAVIFLLIKVFTIGPDLNDENVYFYMGQLVADGAVPYKDFFFAHPPLQVLLYSVLIKIFGFHFLLMKLIASVITLGTAVFVFLLARERLSLEQALVAAVLYLFAFDVLRFSDFNTGVNLGVFFLVMGTYFLFRKSYYLSGIVFGLAGITRFYTVIPFIIVAVLLGLKNRSALWKIILGFVAVFGVVNGLVIAVFGQQYLEPVVAFHLAKPPTDTSAISLFIRSLVLNPILYVLAGLSLFFHTKRLSGIVAMVGLYAAFLVLWPSVFNFYFLLLFPFLAIMAARGLITGCRSIKLKTWTWWIVGAILLVLSLWNVNNYIHFELNDFEKAGEIAAYIEENSRPDETLFGDDSITPLLALMSDRKIALDFADSNNQRFRSGITDANETIAALQGNLKYFIVYKVQFGPVQGVYGPAFVDEFSEYIAEECRIVERFTEEIEFTKVYEVYDCS